MAVTEKLAELPSAKIVDKNGKSVHVGLLIFMILLVVIYMAYAAKKDERDLISSDSLNKQLDEIALSNDEKEHIEKIVDALLEKRELKKSLAKRVQRSLLTGMARGFVTGGVTGGQNGAILGAILLGTVGPLTIFLDESF